MVPAYLNGDIVYFAYDANLSRAHMALWCPAATPLMKAALVDYRLVFRTRADIVPSRGDRVQGALYEVGPHDLAALDEFEDCPALYRRVRVWVVTDGGPVEATTHQMNPGHPLALPDPDYLNLVMQGYDDWELDFSALTVVS
jgi:gamma-glutamylcyclotransferase (GGCT)/AIG2-like uncharacterized protein YtfP